MEAKTANGRGKRRFTTICLCSDIIRCHDENVFLRLTHRDRPHILQRMDRATTAMHSEVLGIARRAKPREPMETLNEVLVTIEAGVQGDCHGSEPDRQVTVISADSWRDACRDLAMEVPWTKRRANLLLGGIDLRDTDGALISIGDVQLEVVGENPPCRVMDIQQDGLREALKPGWRAGVSCRVLTGGKLRVGDSVRLRRP